MTKSIIFITIFSLVTAVAFAESPILVGVLEQPQRCGEQSDISARILFYKEGTRWQALGVSGDNKPSSNWDITSITWTIALDGKNLGKTNILETKENNKFVNDWFYRRDKIQKIKSLDQFPKIKNTSKSFSGWCSIPDYRPLIIISQPNFTDPETWKPFAPDESLREKLFPFLRVSIGRLKSKKCESEPSYRSVPFDFKISDTMFYKSYKSSKNQWLISFGINPSLVNCEAPFEPELSGNWFFIHGQDIDFIGREMELVDAGDYDGDGSDEFLFWHSGYNQDGYILIYNDFRESAEYLWGYH